jgi:hypothetical protein
VTLTPPVPHAPPAPPAPAAPPVPLALVPATLTLILPPKPLFALTGGMPPVPVVNVPVVFMRGEPQAVARATARTRVSSRLFMCEMYDMMTRRASKSKTLALAHVGRLAIVKRHHSNEDEAAAPGAHSVPDMQAAAVHPGQLPPQSTCISFPSRHPSSHVGSARSQTCAIQHDLFGHSPETSQGVPLDELTDEDDAADEDDATDEEETVVEFAVEDAEVEVVDDAVVEVDTEENESPPKPPTPSAPPTPPTPGAPPRPPAPRRPPVLEDTAPPLPVSDEDDEAYCESPLPPAPPVPSSTARSRHAPTQSTSAMRGRRMCKLYDNLGRSTT